MSNIFGMPDQAPTEQPVTPAAPVQDPQADLLASITNDSGEQKYKDIPTALNGLAHSQSHIKQIESDNTMLISRVKELEEKVANVAKMETLVEQLQNQQPAVATPAPAGLDESAVIAMIQRQTAAQAQEAQEQTNTSLVVQTLQTKFGDKAGDAFYAKAAELGMSKEAMNNLAKTSPQAALAFFGSTPIGVTPTTPSINTSAMSAAPKAQKVEHSGKSMMLGATKKDMLAEMRRHKEHIYAKNGVQV